MSPVTGDPAGMRASAAQLRLRAETLSGIVAHVEAGVAAMTYAGPAADRFRSSVASSNTNLRAVSERMSHVAETLQRQAAVVEEQLLAQAAQAAQATREGNTW